MRYKRYCISLFIALFILVEAINPSFAFGAWDKPGGPR